LKLLKPKRISKRKISFPLLFLLCLTSCGYHFASGDRIAVSVPYVIGDDEGGLTSALIAQIANHPTLRYSYNEGQWILSVQILNVDDDRVGYRYERRPVSGKLRKHLQGIEDRRRIIAEVVILSAESEEILYGPYTVSADMDYDYVDQDSLKDLSIEVDGKVVQTTEAFSLGQLDTIDAAKSDVLTPLYRKLAQKIIDGITTGCD
jgi:hypothetical protein